MNYITHGEYRTNNMEAYLIKVDMLYKCQTCSLEQTHESHQTLVFKCDSPKGSRFSIINTQIYKNCIECDEIARIQSLTTE